MSDKKKTVLVIDDEEDVRDYLSCLFDDHGFAVETAENGEVGLQKMIARRPSPRCLDLLTAILNRPIFSAVPRGNWLFNVTNL